MKPEDKIRAQATRLMRDKYPNVFFNFRIDKNNGLGNSQNYAKGINSGMPDMEVFAARKGYNGLHIELKTKSGDPFKKMPRKKCIQIENTDNLGLPTQYAEHLLCQAFRIYQINESGFFSCFASGFEEVKKVLTWYLGESELSFSEYSFVYKPGKYELPKRISIPVLK